MAAPAGNNFAAGNPGGGRPSAYDPKCVKVAEGMCRLGATEREVAAALGVSDVTLRAWKLEYEEFSSAMVVGKAPADERVVASLFNRAVGYSYNSEKVVVVDKSVEIIPIVVHVPPDVGAAIKWLSVRRKDEWRETSKVELSGPNGKPIEMINSTMTAAEAAAAYANTLSSVNTPEE